MHGTSGMGAVSIMNGHDADIIQITTEKFERRLAQECGTLRTDMATEFGKVRVDMANEGARTRVEMASELGKLRAEMERANGELRVEMERSNGALRAEMQQGFGAIRVEIRDRNAELLKWALVFGATQTAAIAAVVALIR